MEVIRLNERDCKIKGVILSRPQTIKEKGKNIIESAGAFLSPEIVDKLGGVSLQIGHENDGKVVGKILSARIEDNAIVGDISVSDEGLIDKISKGSVGLSVGYNGDFVSKNGSDIELSHLKNFVHVAVVDNPMTEDAIIPQTNIMNIEVVKQMDEKKESPKVDIGKKVNQIRKGMLEKEIAGKIQAKAVTKDNAKEADKIESESNQKPAAITKSKPAAITKSIKPVGVNIAVGSTASNFIDPSTTKAEKIANGYWNAFKKIAKVGKLS